MKRLSKYLGFRSHLLWVSLIFSMFLACKKVDKTAEAIAATQIDLSIARFDREFAAAKAETIPLLKSKYPYLFPSQFSDSVWVAKLKDTIQLELSEEVDKVFGDFEDETTDLESLFKHVAYYFPKAKPPKIITVTSDVRYNDRVILTDSLLLLGLDNYLGPEHHFYERIQRYIASGLDKKYLASDVASALAKKIVKYPSDRSFLSRMVYYGKELYLKDKLLPQKEDAQKIGYSDIQMQWAIDNEEQIWRYFIDSELLYSTDAKLDRRFLDPAPFSKFGLVMDSDSPGRIGRYIGWQIVRAFMDKNDVTLDQMLSLPADEIFKRSKYKPRK
ncbi:gliding motility lipoprotein GldB [Flagellimonas onchidii]|uniref:gliding motility lipoprotein GldB n=1 Tax=Flagellimonas onchidii TaxID=2562684 RepID=UPI0010A6A971|nr:gliding motility lipoprotein GldB [Allomuricauda onchidii]